MSDQVLRMIDSFALWQEEDPQVIAASDVFFQNLGSSTKNPLPHIRQASWKEPKKRWTDETDTRIWCYLEKNDKYKDLVQCRWEMKLVEQFILELMNTIGLSKQ